MAKLYNYSDTEVDVDNVYSMLDKAVACLRSAGIESPGRDARLLLTHASREYSTEKEGFLQNVRKKFFYLITRRMLHEPISRILGKRGFWTFDLHLSIATFDPRPETETIIELILEVANPDAEYTILDLGTGSGNLLLALLTELPNAIGLGIDVLPDAVATAYINASHYNLTSRVCFQVSNWMDSVLGQFDCIVSNPPYITESEINNLEPEVFLSDPYCTLVGGNDGLDAYRSIAPFFHQLLHHNGIVALEVGYKQAKPVISLMREVGLVYLTCRSDLSGIIRGILFQKKSRK